MKRNLFLNPHIIKKNILFGLGILCLVIYVSQVYAQSDSIRLIRKIALQASSVEADFQGHIYVVTRQNELLKLNDTGGIMRRYSNNYLGTLQLISIHNPLQIVLFYPGFQTLIILDNSLNELKRIAMTQLNIPYVTTLGYSPEREIWYFDEPLKRFKKVNINGRHILESSLENKYQPERVHKIMIQKNEVKVWCDTSMLITMDLNGNMKEQVYQAGDWIYWKEQLTGFFHQQRVIIRDSDHPLPQILRGFPEGLPVMAGLSIMDGGYAAIDQEGVLYFLRFGPEP